MFVACTHAKSDDRYISFYEASAGGYIEITELYVY
jgi:hypothetical protein